MENSTKSKKKILIVNNNMLIGGIQKSLSNLLTEIHSSYDITLFLFNKQGALLNEIPTDIKISEGRGLIKIMGMSQSEAKQSGAGTYIIRSFCAIFTKLFGTAIPFKLLTKSCKLKESYDCSISYMQNASNKLFYGGCNEFVLNSTKAQKKIAFVHSDYKNYEGNNKYNRKICTKFDKIAACSVSCKNRFLSVLPEMKGKVAAVHNCHNFNQIISLSEQYRVDYDDTINLLTVARLSYEKGILRVIPIVKKLIDDGINFVWHIVGDGPDRQKIESEIERLALTDNIILHGLKVNPYPHYKAADLFLLPSYNEAAPLVYGEACCLGLPVLTTNTTSANELVAEKGIGWVCENSDEGIYNSLRKLLSNLHLINHKKEELMNTPLNNSLAVLEFYEIVNEE